MQTSDHPVEAGPKSHHPECHPDTGPKVTIKVNGAEMEVHRGSYTAGELKTMFGVGAEQELDLVIEGQFKPLGDDEHVVLKGGEIFVSHARCGASS